MSRRIGSTYALIALLLIFMIVDVGLANWLLTPPVLRKHVVQFGETVPSIADRYAVHPQALMEENNLLPGDTLRPGEVVSVPSTLLTPLLEWKTHLVGLAAAVVGAFIGLWLCHLSALLPPGVRFPLAGIAVPVVYFIAVQLSSSQAGVALTPLSILNWVKDGLAWSVAPILLATALGFGPTCE
jgi:LysM repeat protein